MALPGHRAAVLLLIAALASTAATTLRLQGTIERYDPATGVLTISTPTGTVQFRIAPGTRIRQGWHAIEASLLAKLTGHRADVHYAESGGQVIVRSVHVSGKGKE